jgi:SET domain-containing protein
MYVWNKKAFAISLGYGSLYNHSYEPNASYIFGPMRLTYKALCDIAEGDEITINYNYYPGNRKPVGFDVKS